MPRLEPPPYYGVCSFFGSAGHSHDNCPGLKEVVGEQAEQLAQVQIARYEAVCRSRDNQPGNRVVGVNAEGEETPGITSYHSRQ